jgi:hypothetical protein
MKNGLIRFKNAILNFKNHFFSIRKVSIHFILTHFIRFPIFLIKKKPYYGILFEFTY